jgi:hypothetical protein
MTCFTPPPTPHADIRLDGHRESWPIRSKRFRGWLRRRYCQATGGTASAAEIRSALDLLEARAQFDAAKRAVHVRIAEHAGHIYLDLANEQWRAGWMARPVRFRRPPGMLPLCASIRRAQFVPQSCRLKGTLNRQCCHTIARDRAAKSFAAIGTLGRAMSWVVNA